LSFFAELKRRNVFRVAAAYAVIGWMVVQVTSVFAPALHLPDWIVSLLALIVVIGFPITLAFAWVYELTPEGLKRTDDVARDESIAHVTGQKINYIIIGSLVAAVLFVVADRLVLRDRAAGVAPAQASAAPPAEPAEQRTALPNSVAVLPFANMSPNAADAYFAQGVHEEVLNQLAKLKALNVIARTSVLRYADTQIPIPDIARELNVQTIMEGSVRYAGDSVRITAQLIDPKTGAHLWSEAYQGKIDDIFAIQADVAMNIANALRAEFSLEEQQAIERRPTSSPEAYALYLQAKTGSTASYDDQLALLDRALALDPDFAGAYGHKAFIYSVRFVDTWVQNAAPPEERNDLDRRVRDNAARALALDTQESSARGALQRINVVTWRWSEFEHLPADYVPALPDGSSLWIFAWIGKPADAVRYGERLAQLDPNSAAPHYSLGPAYAYAGDRAASNRALSRVLEIDPTTALARVWLAFNAIVAGDAQTALVELRRVEQQFGDRMPVAFLPEIGYAYSRLGRADDARRLFGRIEKGENDKLGDGTWAMGYLAIGDEQRALERLEAVAAKARRHEPDRGQIAVMNLKMNFLADPRLDSGPFKDVLDRIRGD
jgi:TolB-like protein